MRITVVIPIYNVSDFIVRCIDSVKSQTFKGEIECLLVDDCGQDDSMVKALEATEAHAPNIQFEILKHDKNRGLSAARNTGIIAATGEYIYFLDSDDEITPKCLELLADKISEYPGIELVQGTTKTLPKDDDYYSIKQYKNIKYIEGNERIRQEYYKMSNGIPVNAWNKLVSLEFIRRNNLYFKEGIIHEDQHWMFHVARCLRTIAFVQYDTYLHYRNETSIMKSSSMLKSNRHWGILLLDIIDKIDEPMFDMQLAKYMVFYISRYNRRDGLTEYETLYEKFAVLLDQRGYHKISKIFRIWHSHNNVVLRVMLRTYCKQIMAKKKSN